MESSNAVNSTRQKTLCMANSSERPSMTSSFFTESTVGNNLKPGCGIVSKFDEEKVGTDCNTERVYTLVGAHKENEGDSLTLGTKLAESQYDKSFFSFYLCWYVLFYGVDSHLASQ